PPGQERALRAARYVGAGRLHRRPAPPGEPPRQGQADAGARHRPAEHTRTEPQEQGILELSRTIATPIPMSLPPIRVLIADDHPIWRRGVRDLLSTEADINIVAEAANGQEALRLIRSTRLDVALLDM